MKINGFGSLSDEHIEEIESRYALSLPADYKTFFKKRQMAVL
ncbi:hypothetical protein MFLO_01025 [Listeria floridensis FSL S10-1187]|uniref:SMI1/KNR4 family protein n=1 Tax=Listeria floridensis FSL S10-1187 TaxID=1265817 RepID=A0ABP3B1M8_9LIST|nr:SMI1/KNR4 family protein [Listeria floridensis]EUJ33773.1 hypothetical protein MFLO_01025 [Listeria floridensis FSL S10-1187]